MTNELVKLELNEIMTLGDALASSGYFSDAKEASQAVVKVLAGQELGIGPVAAMSGLYIVKGRVVIGGNIMASLVKSSPKYDYKITRHDNQVCEIDFFENDEPIGTSEFNMEMAKRAGLTGKDNWKNFPENMLFNRALSNGAKWFCPDLFAGQSVYAPDEIVEEEKVVYDAQSQPMAEVIKGEAIEDKKETEVLTVARQKWIESIVNLENFPIDGSPAEKVSFINEEFQARELEIEPVAIPDVLALG